MADRTPTGEGRAPIDLTSNPDFRLFAQRWRDTGLPGLEASSTAVVIAGSSGDDVSVQGACELGFILLLGKPLLLLVAPGDTVSPGLLRAADEVVHGDLADPGTAEATAEALAAAIERMDSDAESDAG